MARILVVDDDAAIRELVALALEKSKHIVHRAASADEARAAVAGAQFDAVISDIYMPGDSGLALLEDLRRTRPQLPVILVTARGSVETAALAARIGAFEYLAKPFDVHELVDRVSAALRPPAPCPPGAPGIGTMIIGSHPAIVEVYKAVARVAPLSVPVLITGETGTGKELVARALHRFGQSPDGPFVPVNCGAIPDTLLESELFGHRRGAFTDARHDHRGAVMRADGGTLFLDEVGDVSIAFQVKLLRFLQDHVVRPLGAEDALEVDVSVVAATHQDLKIATARGAFREDLFFRLAGYEIRIPPLRARLEDLPSLVEHFRARLTEDMGLGHVPPATPEVLDLLTSHSWPGNIRELQHVLRRCLIDGRSLSDLRLVQRVLVEMRGSDRPAPAPITTPVTASATLAEAERAHILAVLASTSGNRSAAARILGIERKTLLRKIRSLGIELAGTFSGRSTP